MQNNHPNCGIGRLAPRSWFEDSLAKERHGEMVVGDGFHDLPRGRLLSVTNITLSERQ